jgi:hypothetical protein
VHVCLKGAGDGGGELHPWNALIPVPSGLATWSLAQDYRGSRHRIASATPWKRRAAEAGAPAEDE